MFWLVLHSGRAQRLPEGGYKKTKEAGGHVQRLFKGSKHPLHNPNNATITTTGEEEETCCDPYHTNYIRIITEQAVMQVYSVWAIVAGWFCLRIKHSITSRT